MRMQAIAHRDLSPSAARSLTERIKSCMGDLIVLVVKAHAGRVWLALGYESWADYIKGEFDHAPLSLEREQRKAVVALLRGHGMSTRAIGAATGTSDFTVRNDLSGAINHAPDEPLDVEVESDALAEELIANDPPVTTITGLDGKTYPVRTRPVPNDDERPTPQAVQPAPPQETVTCPTCGGTGRIPRHRPMPVAQRQSWGIIPLGPLHRMFAGTAASLPGTATHHRGLIRHGRRNGAILIDNPRNRSKTLI